MKLSTDASCTKANCAYPPGDLENGFVEDYFLYSPAVFRVPVIPPNAGAAWRTPGVAWVASAGPLFRNPGAFSPQEDSFQIFRPSSQHQTPKIFQNLRTFGLYRPNPSKSYKND